MCDKTKALTTFVEGKTYISNEDEEFTFVSNVTKYSNVLTAPLLFLGKDGIRCFYTTGISPTGKYFVKEKPVETRYYTNIYHGSVGGTHTTVEDAKRNARGGSAGLAEQVWCDGKLIAINLLPA